MHDLVLHPATKALHYAVQLFEGMKAYRGFDGKIRLFRPELNTARFALRFPFNFVVLTSLWLLVLQY